MPGAVSRIFIAVASTDHRASKESGHNLKKWGGEWPKTIYLQHRIIVLEGKFLFKAHN
jgi:hypothetical protein